MMCRLNPDNIADDRSQPLWSSGRDHPLARLPQPDDGQQLKEDKQYHRRVRYHALIGHERDEAVHPRATCCITLIAKCERWSDCIP